MRALEELLVLLLRQQVQEGLLDQAARLDNLDYVDLLRQLFSCQLKLPHLLRLSAALAAHAARDEIVKPFIKVQHVNQSYLATIGINIHITAGPRPPLNAEESRGHVVVEVPVVPDAEKDAHSAHKDGLDAPDVREHIKRSVTRPRNRRPIQVHFYGYFHLDIVVFFLGASGQRIYLEYYVLAVNLGHIIQVYLFVLKEELSLIYAIWERLLYLGVHWDPEQITLLHDAFFLVKVGVKEVLVVEHDEELAAEELRDFLLRLAFWGVLAEYESHDEELCLGRVEVARDP